MAAPRHLGPRLTTRVSTPGHSQVNSKYLMLGSLIFYQFFFAHLISCVWSVAFAPHTACARFVVVHAVRGSHTQVIMALGTKSL